MQQETVGIPHLFKITNDQINQFIFYAGEEHSFDPNHPEWKIIEKFWNEFLEVTIDSKRIAFVEAGLPPLTNSTDEAIKKYGGTGLIMYLAAKEGVEIINPEPKRKEEINELLNSFSKEEIAYYYFARVVNQWFRKKEPRPQFNDYIDFRLKSEQTASGWTNFDFSIENMKKIHKKIFKHKIDLINNEFFQMVSNPTIPFSLINQVAKMSSNFRDKYILEIILNYWRKGYSIYIEYGSHHAIKQTPILKREIYK